MNALAAARFVLRKDLLIELRTKEIVVTTGLFAVLVVVLASLSFYLDPGTAPNLAPGALWIAITFAGVLAMGRSWARERENDAMRGLLLSPIPRSGIYLGKAAAAFVYLSIIEVLLLPLVALFFHLDLLPVLGPVVALLVLGTIGFVAAGTLFSALTVRTGARDLVLSVVVFPLVTPALLSAVVATRELFGGTPVEELGGWFRVLVAYDLTFLTAGTLLYDTLMSD